MQKKPVFIVRIFLAVFLFSLFCSAAAQDWMSDFKQALIQTGWTVQETAEGDLILIFSEQPSTDYAQASTDNTQASTENISTAEMNMHRLANELEASGWKVERKKDGSLLLIPRTASRSIKEEQAAKSIAPENDQWQQLQQQLQEAGWFAEREADGSLLLVPPGPGLKDSSISAADADVHEKMVPQAIDPVRDDSFRTGSISDMQQRLRETGWHVNNQSDGSILLYPPGKSHSEEILRPVIGTAPSVPVNLPVDSWQEAHDLAENWLNNQNLPHATVGKIRHIVDIYLISIVADKAPHKLMHQIAIRKEDGAIILLN